MMTEIFGRPIEVLEGTIVDEGSRTNNYVRTTTTVYKEPDSLINRTETNTSYSSYTHKIFTLRNEATGVTDQRKITIPKVNSKIGNRVRVFSTSDYNFALVDDTTKTLFISTSFYYQIVESKRSQMVWLSVPIILISGFMGGFLAGVVAAFSIPILMLLTRISVRYTLWQSRSEFTSAFEGYKVKYRWG